jgi:hypothetical protein
MNLLTRWVAVWSSLVLSGAATAQVELVARIAVPGTERDLSRNRAVASSGVPQNRLGGFGSAIDFDAASGQLWTVADRGPADGESVYRCRAQVFDLDLAGKKLTLSRTLMLTRADGVEFVGDVRALAGAQTDQLRLDPEGVRLIPGGMVVSEEYGPFIDVFDRDGKQKARLAPPAKFMVKQPADTPEGEMPPNNSGGRQANRGFEGLALHVDGTKVLAMLQSPLLQDSAMDARMKRVGLGVRVLEMSLDGTTTREFVYVLEKPKNGVSEILAVDAERYLVLERDGDAGRECKSRAVYVATTRGAVDVSGVESLPIEGAGPGAGGMAKEPFIDFLDPSFGLAGDTMPEKIEGLAWGPTLPDGRATLLVSTDNDFKAEYESWLWVFAFDRAALPAADAIGALNP